MKKDFFEDRPISAEYFFRKYLNSIPVRFSNIHNIYNINYYGINFDLLVKHPNISKFEENDSIAGLVQYKDGEIELYYNNTNRFDNKEQRYILANLLAYVERQKTKEAKESVIKNYNFMMRCDYPFDKMSMDEFNECLDNKYARQILMPQEEFNKDYYKWYLLSQNGEIVMRVLSDKYQVPFREIVNRCNELGLDNTITLSYENNEPVKVNKGNTKIKTSL